MLREQKSADELQEYLRYVRTEWMGLEDAPQMNERERALAPRLDGSTRAARRRRASRPSWALANIRAWEMTVMTIETTRDSLHAWRKPRRRTNVRLYGTPAILKT